MKFLRRATIDDMDLIYDWANDPVVRSNSFNTNSIRYEDHQQWYKNVMEDASVLLYILMDDEIPIGQIRLNIQDSEAEISYSVSAEYRGKGYGKILLELIVDEVKISHPEIKTLLAKVKPDNLASNKLFVDEGYDMGYSCYNKKLSDN